MAFQRSSGNRATGDLPDLLRRYVRQETVEPLRSAGRFLTYGLAGATTLGLGTVLLTGGWLRALQTWSVLDGHWSWVPYLAASAAMAALGALALSRIGGRTGLDG